MPKVFLIGESHQDPLSVLFAGKLAVKYDMRLAIEGGAAISKNKGMFGTIDRFKYLDESEYEIINLEKKDAQKVRELILSKDRVIYLQYQKIG